jgi:hypothetical protein
VAQVKVQQTILLVGLEQQGKVTLAVMDETTAHQTNLDNRAVVAAQVVVAQVADRNQTAVLA